jgi:hypothetical protein
VYAQATKRRDRMAETHRKAYDAAIDWAAMSSSEPLTVPAEEHAAVEGNKKAPFPGPSESG